MTINRNNHAWASSLSRRAVAKTIVGAPLLLAGTGVAAQENEAKFHSDGIDLNEISPKLLPYGGVTNYPIGGGEDFDEEGVRRNRRAGVWHDNPVTQSQYGMMTLASYRDSGDEAYLDAAIANATRIHENGEDVDGRTYFSYPFEFPLFGRKDMMLTPPWYSGMAQGQVLQLYTQLWVETADSQWKQYADAVFESFREPMNTELPWWPNVDENGNLWFEEYPYDPEQHVFNGHVFAIAGMYEYWMATKDPWAEELCKGAIRTILDRKDDFRVEGHQSRYALGQLVQHDTYHIVHIDQLLFLYAVTENDGFAQTADMMADDSDLHRLSGSLTLRAGEHIFPEVEVDSSLLVMGDDATVSLDSDQDVIVSERRAEFETKRIFYRIASEEFAGTWVAESEAALLLGKYLGRQTLFGTTKGTLMEYVPPRPFTLEAGTWHAYSAESTYFTAAPDHLEIPERTACTVSARVLITADPYMLVDIADTGSYWVEVGEHLAPVG